MLKLENSERNLHLALGSRYPEDPWKASSLWYNWESLVASKPLYEDSYRVYVYHYNKYSYT